MMTGKTKVFVIFLLLSCTPVFAKLNLRLNPDVLQAYRTIMDSQIYEEKKGAAEVLYSAYVEDKDETVIDVVIDLLTYNFNYAKFNEQDTKMYNDDRVARRLVQILELSHQPKGFPVLAKIVAKRNHTETTIMSAWQAIKAINWNLENNTNY